VSIVLIDRADKLDMAELLRRDAREQVEERPCALARAEIKTLERVVEPGRHFPKFPAEQLLHCSSAGRIRLGWRWQIHLNSVEAKNHGTPSR